MPPRRPALRLVPYVVALLLAVALAPACVASAPARVDAASPLYVRATGPVATEAPPLVVPGAAWVERDLDPLTEQRTLVLYDPRGRGRSPALSSSEEASVERDVADLERLREDLGLERIALLGWSYYGAIAVRYALAHPERVERLVLVAPLPPRRTPHWDDRLRAFVLRSDASELREIDELRRGGLAERDLEAYSRRVTEASLHVFLADPAHAERMKSDPNVRPNLDPDASARLAARIVGALGDWDWRGELAALRIPVLVVHGSEDPTPIAGSREYAESLPNGTLEVVEGVGHMPWIEAPDAFFPTVGSFLATAEDEEVEP